MNTIIAQPINIANHSVSVLDGLYSLTDLHKASGGKAKHRPTFFLQNQQTNELISEIKAEKVRCGNSNIKEPVRVLKGKQKNGLSQGTYVCKELVYAYAMWISAKFSLLVIRTFDKLTHNGVVDKPKLDDLSNVQTRKPLKDAVNMMVPKCHLSYSDCYKIIHQRFSISSIEELTNEQVTAAVEYVHTKIVEGELLQKDDTPNRRTALLLMKKGSMAKAAQLREIEKLEDMIFAVKDQLNTIKKYSGSISDGLSEAQIRIGFTTEESDGATEEARDRFYARYGKQPI